MDWPGVGARWAPPRVTALTQTALGDGDRLPVAAAASAARRRRRASPTAMAAARRRSHHCWARSAGAFAAAAAVVAADGAAAAAAAVPAAAGATPSSAAIKGGRCRQLPACRRCRCGRSASTVVSGATGGPLVPFLVARPAVGLTPVLRAVPAMVSAVLQARDPPSFGRTKCVRKVIYSLYKELFVNIVRSFVPVRWFPSCVSRRLRLVCGTRFLRLRRRCTRANGGHGRKVTFGGSRSGERRPSIQNSRRGYSRLGLHKARRQARYVGTRIRRRSAKDNRG